MEMSEMKRIDFKAREREREREKERESAKNANVV